VPSHSIPVPSHSIDVLLVEDNPYDAELTVDALARADFACRVAVVDDGLKAIAYLRRQPPYEKAPRPDLVLLDLGLPESDGREVLLEVKADPGLAGVPVVVWTSSEAEADVQMSYRVRANAYVTKPVEADRFAEIVRFVVGFWATVARLPVDPQT
jgi:two-component system, chemotaxis family, response regulator Rcp1